MALYRITDGHWKEDVNHRIDGYLVETSEYDEDTIDPDYDDSIFYWFDSDEDMNNFIAGCKNGEDMGDEFIILEVELVN